MPSATFYARSLTELLANRARDQPNEHSIHTGVPGCDASVLRSLTYSQVQKAVDRLAWHYSTLGLCPPCHANEIPPVRIIAVLTSPAYDESLLEMALAKLGLTALLLSVNNSVAAVAHLCQITNSAHLIYGTKFASHATEAQQILKDKGYNLDILEDTRFPLWGPDGVEAASVKPYSARLSPEIECDRPAVILHSSGSTGFPKPVYITHFGLIANVSLNQNLRGFSTLPVYHGYGHFAIFRCMYSGKPMTLFPGHLPLTCANICQVIKASPPVQQCFAVPYVIKLMGETLEGIDALAQFDVIGYAGAALPDDLGDRLTAAGVKLLSIYGTTETGSLMNSQRDFETDKDWNWVRPLASSAQYLVMESHGSNTYEVIVKHGYPPKIETNRPDGSYATKDLFMRHPQHHDRYKYVGRLDDTLVQTLGEKTNPVPIELAIRGNSPYVSEAIVFGAGRPQIGCLILPSELARGLNRAELMEKIWPVVEKANSEAPTHSRLLSEMIEFLSIGTDIPVATKMSILRPACYAKFKDLIDSIYQRFEQGATITKVTLTLPELEDFLLSAIVKVMGPKSTGLTKDVDLFSFGVDSLQATRVRNTLQQSLELNGQTLGQNVVYEHPSVRKLAGFINELRSGNSSHIRSSSDIMLSLLDKYSARFASHSPSGALVTDERHVVVLTGATGSLGAHILAQLCASPAVRKVICLSRANSHAESLVRVRDSLKSRKLCLSDESKVESYAANVNVSNLGLSNQEYESIRDQATIIIHNAWPVNFVLTIESYDEHIGGALNLINLALESPHATPASFFFSSSISAMQGTHDEGECPEKFSTSPRTAGGTGYAQSKWTTEKLCQRAADHGRACGFKVGVLRIGQMVGDSINGVWNETEAWPLMFKGANTVGYLPLTNEHPSWLPVDYAGRAIAEISLHPTTGTSDPEGWPASNGAVYHVVNPDTSVDWNALLDGLQRAGLEFGVVDVQTWLGKLRTSDSDPARNPIIKLLPFFENRYRNPDRKPIVFSTYHTRIVAPSLASAPALNAELIGKWVKHWREIGFLQ